MLQLTIDVTFTSSNHVLVIDFFLNLREFFKCHSDDTSKIPTLTATVESQIPTADCSRSCHDEKELHKTILFFTSSTKNT